MDSKSFELDRAANAMVMRRSIRASPEKLFDAWTRPEQINQWWDPSGRPLAACEVELRLGGILRLVNMGAEQYPFEGRFREIDPPHGFVFDAMGAMGSVRFTAEGDLTQMTVVIRCASPEQLEQFVQMGIGDGTCRSLDNLVTFMGGQR